MQFICLCRVMAFFPSLKVSTLNPLRPETDLKDIQWISSCFTANCVSNANHLKTFMKTISNYVMNNMKHTNILFRQKYKIKLSLCLTNWALRQEDIRGADAPIHIFITSDLAGGEWSASCPGHFTPHPQGKESLDPIAQKVRWAQRWSRQNEVEKILDLTGTQILAPQLPVASSLWKNMDFNVKVGVTYGINCALKHQLSFVNKIKHFVEFEAVIAFVRVLLYC
jgi:hypothetical protein